MATSKPTARVIGALFLIATASYIVADGLLDPLRPSADFLDDALFGTGRAGASALFFFLCATANVLIGVLFYRILRPHSESIALGYVVTRMFDGAGVAFGAVVAVALAALGTGAVAGADAPDFLPLVQGLVASKQAVFVVTMAALGFGSIPFTWLLLQSGLLPRWMGWLGVVGYVSLFVGSVLELFQVDLLMLHYVPGGLFEVILPLWLLVKGFNSLPDARPGTA